MKVFRRVLLVIALIILIGVITGYFLLHNIRTSALPDYSKDVVIPGLKGEVVISRDEYAIPHIHASNDYDLYLATGFVMAQDRLWQMDLMRRITQGRLSEIMGKEQVKTDLLMRALRIEEKSVQVLNESSPEVIAALEAFAAGVNHYIRNYPMPPEFRILRYKPELWQPVHSVNLIGYMSWDLTSGWGPEVSLHKLAREATQTQISELLPGVRSIHEPVFPDIEIQVNWNETLISASDKLGKFGAQIFSGSNNWAVSGAKSGTGKPLLANDMHLGFFAPGIWYQMHQTAVGSTNVTGLVLPGQPFVICGHNDSIAWGMTNVAVDNIDFYKETINDDTTQYFMDGAWHDLKVKDELVKTKAGEELTFRQLFTHRGPIINEFKNENEAALSMRWIGNEFSNELRTVYLLNRASDWQTFRDAVKSFISVSQNMVYADVAGNIGLQTAAGIPLREEPGFRIFPGDTSLYDWKEMVPFEELPYEFNPSHGYVTSANNKTVPDNYPYYIGTWFSHPDRNNRIREMLAEKDNHTIADFMDMHHDFLSKKAERYVPFFLDVDTTGMDPIYKDAYEKLQTWNYVLDKGSQAASIFEIMYRRVAENIVSSVLSEEAFKGLLGERLLIENLMEHFILNKNSAWLGGVQENQYPEWKRVMHKSFVETVQELEQHFGKDTEGWQWGLLHTFTISHPLGVVSLLDKTMNLNRGPYQTPGSFHTLTPYSYSYNNLYKVIHGASQRHIYDLSDWDASKTIIPTGISGIPESKYYLDQTEMFLNNEYHTDPYSQHEVEKSAIFKMKLMPR